MVSFDMVRGPEHYLRRIGRSDHCDREKTAISFVTNHQRLMLRNLEKYYGTGESELP